MAFMNWNESLSVRIDSIDDQHKKLIDLINDFYDNIQRRSNSENISELIRGMKSYTQLHFATEERYMQRLDYPNYAIHKSEHDNFMDKVTALEEKFNSGKIIISFEITGFLKDWVRNHIQVVDKQYSDFLIKNGIE